MTDTAHAPTSRRRARTRARRRRTPSLPSAASSAALLLSACCLSRRRPLLLPPAAAQCNPCEGKASGFVQLPDKGCAEFAQCDKGAVSQKFKCQGGLIYDAALNQCNWAFAATCGPDPSCPPTISPSARPTAGPSDGPTDGPTEASTPGSTLPPATFAPTDPPVAPAPPPPGAGGGGGGGGAPAPEGGSPGGGGPAPRDPIAAPVAPPRGLPPIRHEHHAAVWAHLNANKIPISNQLLRSAQRTLRNLHGNNVDADELRDYAYYDFYGALRSMAEEGYAVPPPVRTGGGEREVPPEGVAPPPQGLPPQAAAVAAREVFYLGDPRHEDAAAVGLVNVAAFLSQAMADSIASGSCDELNEELVGGTLPASNACGQRGRSYQDMRCPAGEEHMACAPYPDMEAQARPNGRSVAPFYCGSTERYPFTGTADYIAGRAPADVPVPNQNGRTDVEGCCWWGRGTLQTRGICQYGKLDYYLGARAAREGRPARYPQIDFCAYPESVCSAHPGESAVEWIAGLFRWIDGVQSYQSRNDDGSVGWSYVHKLHEFVMGGMTDGLFIHSVSSIVTFGCHEAPCQETENTLVEMTDVGERWSYFLQVLEALGLPVKALRQG